MDTSQKIDQFIAENGGNARDALNVALARIEAIQAMIKEAVDETESKRFFSFQYSFWDEAQKRNRYGVWNCEMLGTFPPAESLIWRIEAYLMSENVFVEHATVCLNGWQEFGSEEDYRNFTR